MQLSARSLLGLPIVSDDDKPSVIGTAETLLINPKTMVIEGLLVGRAGSHGQLFLPLQCISEATPSTIQAFRHLIKKPADLHRILGLAAWTNQPKFLAGFVYDCFFSMETGVVDSFAVHQLIRTWRVPATAIEKITPKTILIDTDTTVKLKLTPYVQ